MKDTVRVVARLKEDPVQGVLGFNTALYRCDTRSLRQNHVYFFTPYFMIHDDKGGIYNGSEI